MHKEMWYQPRGAAVYTQQGWFLKPMAKPKRTLGNWILRVLSFILIWGLVIYMLVIWFIGG